ncbi:phosphatase PAP2 family protein [Vibrio mexicanus]|uniref:phosphatase PAP2 family protein n=1 Tax=Vibrio mexicanus TaxID=1004326 RepID=UPI00063CCBE9|nr:phosphatase PAP2 family protein [Vibrio mexicanus]
MKTKPFAIAALASALFSTFGHAQDFNAINQTVNDDYVVAGDYLAIGIPAAGFVAAWIHDDWEGAKQLTISGLGTQTITELTKKAIGRHRPNTNLGKISTKSFPSGHAAGAFSGAAFLQTRYGAAWGIPAYAGAAFVAASRVHGNRHHADDVLAGASIAFLVNQFVVSPYVNEGVAFNLTPNKDNGLTFGVSISNQALEYDQGRERGDGKLKQRSRHRFQFDMGFNTLDSVSQIDAHGQLQNSQLVDEHQPFAAVQYDYALDKESSFEINVAPNETRRYGIANNGLTIGDTTYEDGDKVYMAFKQWSLGASYLKHYQLTDQLKVSGGLGLYAHYLEVQSDKLQGGKHDKDNLLEIMPAGSIKAKYSIIGGLSALASAQYQWANKNSVTTTEVGLVYEVNPEWEFGIKYTTSRNQWRSINTKYDSDSVVMSFANRF